MEILKTGEFFGNTNEIIHLDDITITDTEYTHSKVDWHYHENAYFTFILEGNVLEGNQKETCHCSAGSLLFHKHNVNGRDYETFYCAGNGGSTKVGT